MPIRAWFTSCLLCATALASGPERLRLELGGGAAPLDLVRVHAGTFRQGSPTDERSRGADERAHQTTISRDFYLGEVPVTRAQFARFVAASNYRTEAERGTSGGFGLVGNALVQRRDFSWRAPGFVQGDAHPVVLVTWADAEAFAGWLSRTSGRTVRLPTEAEWELACRAGTETPYYGAFDETGARALGWFRDAGGATHEVRGKRQNGLQLHDLVGHVQEWTRDAYAPYGDGDASDPDNGVAPAGEPLRRVLRGGSFLTKVATGRCAARGRATPGSRNADIGFRVVVEDAPAAQVTPLTPPTPTSTPTPTVAVGGSSNSDGLGLLPYLLGGLGVLATIFFVARRKPDAAKGATRSSAGADKDVRVSTAADGFRIHAPVAAAGRHLRYRCSVDGKTREATVRIEPSPAGQFIYLGGTPAALVVLGIADSAQALDPAASATASTSSSSAVDDIVVGSGWTSDGNSGGGGGGGFPPAY